METDKQYFAVGLFVLLTAFAAAAFALWMVGPRDDSKYAPYRIRFSESVNGLDSGSPVKFRGVSIGKVVHLDIDPADSRLIRVDVSLLKTAPIKTDTVASLKMQGITGAVYVELTGSSPKAPPLNSLIQEGDIPEIPAETSSISAIVNVLPEILQKVSVLTEQITKVFNDQNLQTFGEMINHLNKTSQQLDTLLSRTNEAAGGQYQSLYKLLNNLNDTTRQADELVRSLKDDPSKVIIPTKEKGIPAP